MIAKKPWVDYFNINPSDYKSWSQKVPAAESITFWCLKNNKIESGEYLTWARNYYGLCSLTDDFFNQPANANVWNQLQSVANWNSSLFPIAQWGNTVYLACVEPQDNTPWSFDVQYVLAPAEKLEDYWNSLQTSFEKPEVTITDRDATQLIAPPHPTAFSEDEDTEQTEVDVIALPPTPDSESNNESSFSSKKAFESNFEDMPIPPIPSADTPEGFILYEEDNDEITDIHTDDPTDILDDPRALSAEAVSNAPEGLNINLDDYNVEESSNSLAFTDMDAPEGLNLNTPDFPAEEDDYTNGVVIIDEAQDVDSFNNNLVPMTPPPAPPTQELNFEKPSQNSAKIEAEKQSNTDIDPFKKGKISDIISDLGNARSEKDVASFFFEQLHQEYTKCMLLIMSQNGIIPWIWDNTWEPQNREALDDINIQSPSVFKIVHKTKLPYHGYVVENPINASFFNAWGLNELPECLTICPLKQGDHVFGMLLCVGTKDKSNSSILAFAEKICEQLIDEINRQTIAA